MRLLIKINRFHKKAGCQSKVSEHFCPANYILLIIINVTPTTQRILLIIINVTPTTQYVPISSKKKANEDQLPESNVPNMQSNSEVSVPTYGNLTLQPRIQQTNKNRYDRPPKNSTPCPFLLRRGWCRKGDRCDFQHLKPSRDTHKHNVPCPFLQNRGFCLKDDRCDFSHAWVPTRRSVLRTTTQ